MCVAHAAPLSVPHPAWVRLERTLRLQESVPQHDALIPVGCGLQMPFFQEINDLATLNCTSALHRAANVGSASSAA